MEEAEKEVEAQRKGAGALQAFELVRRKRREEVDREEEVGAALEHYGAELRRYPTWVRSA